MSASLDNFYFTAFPGVTSSRLFAFDATTAGHREVFTDTGLSFRPYGNVFTEFGRVLIAGRAGPYLGSSAEGYELWELNDNGSLSLFSDIYPGAGSSYPDTDERISFPGADGYVAVPLRIDTSIPGDETWLISDTLPAMPLGDLFINAGTVSDIRMPVQYNGKTAFLAELDGSTRLVVEYDPLDGSFTVQSQFAEAAGGYDFQNLYSLDNQLYSLVQTSKYGKEL